MSQEKFKETSPEVREKLTRREIVAYFVRHGDAEPSKATEDMTEEERHELDLERHLSAEGIKQAREAGLRLAQEIEDGAAIKFYSSPVLRARETAEEMRKAFEEEIRRLKKNIQILPNLGGKKELVYLDELTETLYAEAQKKAEKLKVDPITYWMLNPEILGETVEKSAERFASVVKHLEKLSSRLPIGPDYPKLHLIFATHSGLPEFWIKKATGEIPEPFKKGESFKIRIPGNKKEEPLLTYKNKEFSIEEK